MNSAVPQEGRYTPERGGRQPENQSGIQLENQHENQPGRFQTPHYSRYAFVDAVRAETDDDAHNHEKAGNLAEVHVQLLALVRGGHPTLLLGEVFSARINDDRNDEGGEKE